MAADVIHPPEATTLHEDPRGVRDWEHWPGRRPEEEEGIRHRLKALFSATDGEHAIEALIDEKGREIEERTDQLQTTITDLERREERTGQLRSAVEEMLRHGSAELDERHAELAALAHELAARDEAVRAAERDIAVRKQELGAVELRRAAVERREQALTEREQALEQRAAELAERELLPATTESSGPGTELVALPRNDPDPAPELRAPGQSPGASTVVSHLLYVADGGYRIVERPGDAQPVGALVELDGTRYLVTRVGRSPLPGDRRPCVYLESRSTPSGS
jgi:hypothetical protein